MANQTDKALSIALETAQACEQVVSGLDKLAALEQERAKSFLNLSDFDAAYEANSGTKHLTGNTLTNVLATSTAAIRGFMVTNNHEDNFQQARP